MRRVGVPGMLTLSLLATAAGIALWMPQLHRQADAMRLALATRTENAAPSAPAVPAPKSGAERTAEYVAGLPALKQNSSDLEKVFALAASRHLALPKGDYQVKQEPNAPLITYSANFPMRSDYAAVKAFASDVLSALPHASLDELRMTRADAGTGVLDSVVRFTFVYRSR
jgi:hypothetical protein